MAPVHSLMVQVSGSAQGWGTSRKETHPVPTMGLASLLESWKTHSHSKKSFRELRVKSYKGMLQPLNPTKEATADSSHFSTWLPMQKSKSAHSPSDRSMVRKA